MAVMPTNTGSPSGERVVVAEAQVGDARAVARAGECRGYVQELERHLRVRRAMPPREDEEDLRALTHT